MSTSYNFVTHDGLNYAIGQIASSVADLYVAKADEKTALSEFTNDANYVVDASYVHTDNNYTSDEKTKLSGIATGAQVNVIETVKVNGTALTPDANKAVDVTVPTAVSDLTNDSNFEENVIAEIKVDGTALVPDSNKSVSITLPTIPTAVSSFTNDAGYQTASDVASAIGTQIGSAYRAAGTIAGTDLVSALLVEANLNKVYNISSDLEITSANEALFLNLSAGDKVKAGDDVGVVAVDVSGTTTYLFNDFAGFVDLSGYVQYTDISTVTNTQIDTMVSTAFGTSGT